MIWSIIPAEDIFAGDAGNYQLMQMEYLGRQVLVEPDQSGYGTIMSICSTNPADFLDQDVLPGQRIPLSRL